MIVGIRIVLERNDLTTAAVNGKEKVDITNRRYTSGLIKLADMDNPTRAHEILQACIADGKKELGL